MAIVKNLNYPAFNYGHRIEFNNSFINFSENGVDQLTAQIDIGSYTLQVFADKLAQALNAAGSQEYTVIVDRVTRRLTISASANFDLLIASGAQAALSAFTLSGFTGADVTGNNAYTSNIASGSQYICQTPLKNFSDFINNKQKAESVVRETPSGLVEAISYGIIERMRCDFPLITDITPQRFIRETNTGVQEARDFLDYIIGKDPIEFLYNVNEENNFVNCILDRTRQDSKGTGYELREKVRQSLPGYYDVSGLVFRKIEVI